MFSAHLHQSSAREREQRFRDLRVWFRGGSCPTRVVTPGSRALAADCPHSPTKKCTFPLSREMQLHFYPTPAAVVRVEEKVTQREYGARFPCATSGKKERLLFLRPRLRRCRSRVSLLLFRCPDSARNGPLRRDSPLPRPSRSLPAPLSSGKCPG